MRFRRWRRRRSTRPKRGPRRRRENVNRARRRGGGPRGRRGSADRSPARAAAGRARHSGGLEHDETCARSVESWTAQGFADGTPRPVPKGDRPRGREACTMTPAEPRTAHPFYMYDAMREQPDAFAAVAARTAPAAETVTARLARCDRLYLVGIGTSYHAALAGEHLVRAYGGGMPVYAAHAFDFALYGPPLGPRDAVITVTHRGTKRYTRDALVRAREAGCPTVVITGDGPDARGG